MTVAGHKLSNERIKVAGLIPGNYELKIDGENVGTFSHLALSSKVELQSNEKTPQYQQALAVAELNRERNDVAIRPLRDAWAGIKGLRKKIAEAAEAPAPEPGAKAGPTPEDLKAQWEARMVKIGELLDLAKTYEDRIYAAAQPMPRHYELTRVP